MTYVTNERKKILVVDDDTVVCNLLREYLEREGFHVFTVAAGDAMRQAMSRHEIDLVLLDVRLPGEDGFSLLLELRKTSSVPILMMSQRSEVYDRVAGLEAGADDYLPKPLELRELLARIRAILRRTGRGTVDPEGKVPTKLSFNDFSLNLASRQLLDPEGTEVILTPMEFDILATLVQNAQRVLKRDFLLDVAVGGEASPLDRTVDVHIGRLRRKIERDPTNPSLIRTVRGTGYIFSERVQRCE